jgi:SAM-dependent methyltransferase
VLPAAGSAPAPAGATPATPGKAAPAGATSATAPKAAAAAVRAPASADLFVRHTRAYSADCVGRPVTILQAGASTAGDLGTEALRKGGSDIAVSQIDEDEPVTREAVAKLPDLADCTLGDLRTVPLSPRAFDIVQCASLLQRIKHAELVLDRLIGAIKPGGLLLLRIGDRDSAAGFLDRKLPEMLRRLIWRKRHPGEPGPYPAVYEQLSSARGVQAYALLRGLVIAERQALGGLAGGLPSGPHGFLAAQKLVARLSRGRLTAAHEEMFYVLRKPEDRFARIL